MAVAAFTPSSFRFSTLPTARVAVPTSPAEIAIATVDGDLEDAVHRLYIGSDSPFAGWTADGFASLVSGINYSALREFLVIALAAKQGCPAAARELRTRCR